MLISKNEKKSDNIKMVEKPMSSIMSKPLIEFIMRALNSILLFLWSKIPKTTKLWFFNRLLK